MTDNSTRKGMADFVNEAQDILEFLGSDLMAIDRTPPGEEPDPEIVNNLFRSCHTLKSLSAMFGIESLAELTHQEESLLDAIRLGRVQLEPEVLNLLFESLEVITQMVGAVSRSGDPKEEALQQMSEPLMVALAHFVGSGPSWNISGSRSASDPLKQIGADVVEVLTEYEEHRLKTNLRRGLAVYRLGMRFNLDDIDVNLEDIRRKLKPLGEIITYLPASDDRDLDKLGIDIILVLAESRATLEKALGEQEVTIRELVPAAKLEDEIKRPTIIPVPDLADEDHDRRTSAVTANPPSLHSVVSRVPVAARERALSIRSVSQTVRVDIRKLDKLMNVVGELSVVRSTIARISDTLSRLVGRGELMNELDQANRGFERRLASLRRDILEVRMVPLGKMFDRLSRMVRKVSMELNKEIHFVVSGADTEVDKLITEELSDPLMHIIRNAIDHGVEPTEERIANGKPKFGTVALTAYQKGGHVVIEVEDDGGGIDTSRLLEVAVAKGVVDRDAASALSERDMLNLLFIPGISTSTETTEISGRGVGMDIVKTNVSALGGVIEVQSEMRIGTKITLTLPVTLATIEALMVEVDGMSYAIPLNAVSEAVSVTESDLTTVLGSEAITLRGETLVLCRLSEFFGKPRKRSPTDELYVVVAALGYQRLGLVVDALHGQQDVVIKPLGRTLKDKTSFSGATDIGEERLALVIDTSRIIDAYFSGKDETGLLSERGLPS